MCDELFGLKKILTKYIIYKFNIKSSVVMKNVIDFVK